MDTSIILGIFVAFGYATLLLVGYVYGLFSLFRGIGRGAFAKFNRSLVLRTVVAGSAFLAVTAELLPIDALLRNTLAVCLFLVHAGPCSLGFALGRAEYAEDDAERRKERTAEWLSRWEQGDSADAAPDPPDSEGL
ncbi:MAG: hypothetical protein KIS66_03390 [Fimbriimonadaceae bacterium]|nr:hypothetical protein [Fimbriimonadaceae bacterium]